MSEEEVKISITNDSENTETDTDVDVDEELEHLNLPGRTRSGSIRNALAGSPPKTPEPQTQFLDALPHFFTAENSPNPWPQDSSAKQKNVAIFTSGGDAPGMNAAVRAAAAVCLTFGVKVYAIEYGYQGMIEGGERFIELDWPQIQGMMHKGGTVIGSARCQEFRERSGRLQAAENLVNRGIDCLIAIGGDGTLTGAELFKQEWTSLLKELQETERLSSEQVEAHSFLSLVGLVGSIDNDMCGVSMTIGCDSAMHRIVEAVDSLTTTAQSHQRTFIIEVMGRNCGFLAVMTALACGADYVLIPEHPPDFEDWETAMCDSLLRRRKYTNFSLIIVAEGATDRVRRPITADYVKKVCSERLGHDTRVTTLGHVQRGGSPSAFDRILATRCGAEAALAVLNATPSTPSYIIGNRWNKIIKIDLTEAVTQTKLVGKCLADREWEKVMFLRGPAFRQELNIFLRIRQHHPDEVEDSRKFKVGVFNVGSPACGMNAATKAVVRDFINGGHEVIGFNEGFDGLAHNEYRVMQWQDVKGWSSQGGSNLGTNRVIPSKIEGGYEKIAQTIKKEKLHGLIIIGGFEAYSGALELADNQEQYEEFRIPMAVIPATISNNVPGTAFSLGSDTALNAIADGIDKLKQSAMSSRRRVFVVETMGNFCGYLATAGALAGGADGAYIPEEGIRLRNIQTDIDLMRSKFKSFPSAVVVYNENCNEHYTTEFLTSVFEEEGKFDEQNPEDCVFTARSMILGHLQQGGSPSPLDRVRGARFAAAANHFLLSQMTANCNSEGVVTTPDAKSICVIGIEGASEVATPVQILRGYADFKKRTPKQHWWKGIHRLVRLMEGSVRPGDKLYQGEAEVCTVDDNCD